MNTRVIALLLGLFVAGQTARADDDVMRLFDQACQLERQIQKKQLEFLIQKDPSLNRFAVEYFDAPGPDELRDRIAFEYFWNKGQLRNALNSYTSAARNALTDAERQELKTANPKFAELEKKEAERPGRIFDPAKLSEHEARELAQRLMSADARFRKELNELSQPLQDQIQKIEQKILGMHLKRSKQAK